LTVTNAELFVDTGSSDDDTAFAWLVRKPDAIARAISVTLAPAFTPSVANEQVTRPFVCVQLPNVGVAETNARPAGNTFVNIAEAAANGPRFVTVSV
jgi:hypothetical protein